ncbi:hypothetical protein ARMSODRAFT_192232 [Armillaria solidipes]|uniref:Uncharacterized protein n=1 Tax=Armillaria solidipes TaxID=1076256 RepID=A0A2H3BXY4_9AGAR|nr:hypothetical protein ARMSODRAFT_192232 [Armillaria solidipes]
MLWRQITSAAQNFKLGYNVQRPYPWRGTTPLVCIFFVGLTILLVFVNIPLSAYDVVQEFTYNPNETSPSPPFSDIIPASLRHTAGDFTPQTFIVGDTIKTDSSVFDYVIMEAFPSGRAPAFGNQVASFPYYNNPLSSCDVLTISLTIRDLDWVSFSATISCWIPTKYKMTLSLNQSSWYNRVVGVPLKAVHDLDGILQDLEYGLDLKNISPFNNQSATGLDLSVFPCCVCSDWYAESYIQVPFLNMPYLNDHPPCDNDVAKFQATEISMYYGTPIDAEFILSSFPAEPGGNILPPNQMLVPSNSQLLLQNAFQAIYNIVRLDLGVVSPNQIFASPIMFNKSISSVSLPFLLDLDRYGQYFHCDVGDFFIGSDIATAYLVNDSYANCIRRVRSDSSLDAYSDDIGAIRVPSVSYLRPVFRRKPMLSAISSVFVATFAMVSAAWSLFNFIAGSFCQTQSDVSGCPHCKHCQGPTGDSESVLLSRRGSRYEAIAMGEMQEDGV